MERDCNKCVYHSSGRCSAWECTGTKTVEDIMADARRKFAEWIVNGFSVNEEWYPGRIAERNVFLVNSYTDSNGYCRCNEKNILSSEDIVAEYEKEQE